jgi:hypothetical protein
MNWRCSKDDHVHWWMLMLINLAMFTSIWNSSFSSDRINKISKRLDAVEARVCR